MAETTGGSVLTQPLRSPRLWLLAAVIGVLNSAVLFAFEAVTVAGTPKLWELLAPNAVLVVLLATALSVVYSAVLRGLKQKRIIEPEVDILGGLSNPAAPDTLKAIAVTLLVGAVSLIAGASLGPEAPLTASSVILGRWAANRLDIKPASALVVLTSLGALLVAFFGSLIPAVLPLLMMAQKKQLSLPAAVYSIFASVVAMGTIWLLDPTKVQRGLAPVSTTVTSQDYWVALVVGFGTSILAAFLVFLIRRFADLGALLDRHVPWYLAAALFGLVLGGLYVLGGPTVRFTGEDGSRALFANAGSYTALALAGLVGVKLLATAWTKGLGYRGGLVFPSIYIGVALGLTVDAAFPGLSGTGAVVGGFAGVITSVVDAPIVGAVLVLAALPMAAIPPLFPVAVCAIVGTLLFTVPKRVLAKRQKAPSNG